MRTSSIRLRANARLAILHEDYLEICDGNMLAAMLLSILIYWHDVKFAKKDENLWIWKSHQDFQEDLMFDKPGMKPPHRTTIKTALDLLLKKNFIQWRRNPKIPLDQTRQYLVEIKTVQKAIDALPTIVAKPTMQSRNNDIGMSNNQQSLSENQQCNVGNPTSNTNDYITEITNPEITEEGLGSHEPNAHTLINLEVKREEKRETNPRIPVLTVEPKEQTSSTRVDSDTPVQHSGTPPGLLPPPGAGAAQGDTGPPHRPLTPKEIGAQIEQRKEQILELYGQKIGRKPTRSKANLDGALKLAQDEVNDEDINTTIDAILADSFLAKNLNLTFVHSHVDALAKKPIPLHQSNGANGSPQAEPVIPRGAVRAARERLEARVAREKRMAL